MRALSGNPPWSVRGGFTLLELLVTISIIAILASLSMVVVNQVTSKARATRCTAQMRTLGTAILTYTQENDGCFPRSFHSGGAHREPGWAASIAPYLGVSTSQIETGWQNAFNTFYRCPNDKTTDAYTYSYALNVFFELDPDGDDYTGSPANWRRLPMVPSPGTTILLAETKPIRFADHVMCHQWSSVKAARNALNTEAHDRRSNYLFVDGHVEALRVEETIDPARQLNRWNPSLAR